MLQLLQLGANGAVVDGRSDADDGAAQQGCVLTIGGANAPAGQLGDLRLKLGAVLIVQGVSAGDLGLGYAGLLVATA